MSPGNQPEKGPPHRAHIITLLPNIHLSNTYQFPQLTTLLDLPFALLLPSCLVQARMLSLNWLINDWPRSLMKYKTNICFQAPLTQYCTVTMLTQVPRSLRNPSPANFCFLWRRTSHRSRPEWKITYQNSRIPFHQEQDNAESPSIGHHTQSSW